MAEVKREETLAKLREAEAEEGRTGLVDKFLREEQSAPAKDKKGKVK